MFSKDEVIKNINGLIGSAGRTSGSLSAHYVVCDGGCDELEQVGASDPACDKYEPRW